MSQGTCHGPHLAAAPMSSLLPGHQPQPHSYRADASAPGPRPSEAPVLAGRAGELHALLDAVTHPPSVALVEGEAGIGKSRLIREALAHPLVRGRQIVLGHCRPLREPFPYGPVFDLLRHLADALPGGLSPVCGALRPYLPELAHQLPPAPEPLPDAGAGRHRLFRAVRALLEALGETVMVVEDLHWADDGTRDLLRFLVDDPPARLSVVLSYRREDLPGSGLPLGRAYRHPPGTTSVLIPLRPLDAHAVRSLVAAITKSPYASTEFAAELHRRTAGIPFVIEEVVRTLPADGRDGRRLDRTALDTLAVPTLLQEAIAERMAGLSAAATRVVHAVAVLQLPAREELIAAVLENGGGGTSSTGGADDVSGPNSVLPTGSCSRALREALRAGVLYECGEDTYGFRHALAQQAVYRRLPGPDRRALHRRAIRALRREDPRPYVQLAHHARQSGAPAQWRRFTEEAASAARSMGDLALAVELLEQLLSDERLGREEYARLAVELSRDAVVGLTHRRVTALLRRVVGDSQLPDGVRGEIRLNLGLLLNNQAGRYEEGRVDTELAVEELRERPALAARAMAALAMPMWGDHPHRVYERWIERAEELAAGQPDSALRTAVRGNHLSLLVAAGDPEVWQAAEELLGSRAGEQDRLQLARTCANLADAATCTGHYAAAHRFREEGRRLAAACGATYLEGIVEGTALRIAWYTGHWEGLAERARRTLELARDAPGLASDAHLVLALLASAGGEWDEAADRLERAGLADPANAMDPVLTAGSGAMARLHLARGEHAAARSLALRALRRAGRKGLWACAGNLLPDALAVLVRTGEQERAEDVLADFAEGIAGRDAPLAEAALAACRGTVAAGAGEPVAAVREFERAAAAYRALPQPYYAARAKEAAVRCALAAGAVTPQTAGELVALVEEFGALGATRDAARCRRVLRGTGATLPSRRGRRGYGDQLSPREREVAHLVAVGHTNREIADVLFLSPRTVEQHVAKVLRKLGVRSRAEVPRD